MQPAFTRFVRSACLPARFPACVPACLPASVLASFAAFSTVCTPATALADGDAVIQPPPPLPSEVTRSLPPEVVEYMRAMQQQMELLQQKAQTQDERIGQLQAENGDRWLTEQRAAQIRSMVKDVLADADTRASLAADGATSGYDKNFFIASADNNFRLNIEGQIQARYAFNHLPSKGMVGGGAAPGEVANEYGFELRRVRMNFFGHVIDHTWAYRVQIAFDRDGGNTGRPLTLEDAFLQKNLDNGLYVRLGQWKNFFNYEEINSSRTQQFAERSVLNQYFTTQFVQGMLVGWETDHVHLYGSYNDGGGNRNIQVIQPTGNPTQWALTGRAEWKLAGEWKEFREMQGWIGSEFAAMLGVAVNWQRAGGVPPAGRASVGNGAIPGLGALAASNSQLALAGWTADLNLRGSGWSAWAAFLGSYAYGGGAEAEARGVNGTLSLGAVVQGGFFVTSNMELIARWEGLWVDSDNNGIVNGAFVPNALVAQTVNIVTLGGNWYFAKNAAKFTLDGGYAFNPIRFNTGIYGESLSGADWRASQTGQGTGEVVVRAQVQVLF